MKDYSINSFERKNFILYYDLDALENTITIYYADGTNQLFSYTPNQEKIILQKMKAQVTNGKKFYLNSQNELRRHLFVDLFFKLYLIAKIIFIGSMCSHSLLIAGFLSLGSVLLFKFSILKLFKENGNKIKKYYNLMKDYEKNLEFINKEKNYSNEKVICPTVIRNSSENISHIINNGIIIDNSKEYKNMLNEGLEPYVSHVITDNEEDIEAFTNEGFKDYSQKDVPFININTAGMLSDEELSNLNKLIKENNKPKIKVLSKIDY